MSFILEEKTTQKKSVFKIFWRFVWELKLARYLFLPALVFSFMASLTPQIFLWKISQAVGKYDPQKWKSFDGLTSIFPDTIETKQLLLVLVLATLIFKILSLIGIEIGGQWSTQQLHHKMIKALSRTRTTFFDENPSGRIINRLVGDYANLRSYGIMVLADSQYVIAELFCILLVVTIANPWPSLFIIPVLWLYIRFQSNFAPMVGQSLGLKAVLQGELLRRETDLIYGHDTFSFYGKQRSLLRSIEKIYKRILDVEIFHSRLLGWGYFWMGLASLLFTSIVYIFVLIGLRQGALEMSSAAVILSVVFTLEGSFAWIAMTMTNVSSAATYIQRVFEYVDLPTEDSEEGVTTGRHRPDSIDHASDIEFLNYSMSYRPDHPLILKNISMTIVAGEHIGIIGRTGSGKSSWLQALLRMVFVREGDIRIGGDSVFTFDIVEYRRLFAVIPQDPYLFSGTVRSNLVGSHEKTHDDFLHELLQQLGLNFNLDTSVKAGGSNLSIGEKQIICIIRGIVQKKNFILLDEPTGSLDHKTADQIQNLIRHHLKGRTVILIAHRLESLRNFDRIFNFESGRLIRTGTPAEVLPNITT